METCCEQNDMRRQKTIHIKKKRMQVSLMDMWMPKEDARTSTVGVGWWHEVELTIDSWACDMVMPVDMCPGITLHESVSQRKGLEYAVAKCETIGNEGEEMHVDDSGGYELQQYHLPRGGTAREVVSSMCKPARR